MPLPGLVDGGPSRKRGYRHYSSTPGGFREAGGTQSGFANQARPRSNYTSKLGQGLSNGDVQGHEKGQGHFHQIRHPKTHVSPIREVTHRSWTHSDDVTEWLHSESPPGASSVGGVKHSPLASNGLLPGNTGDIAAAERLAASSGNNVTASFPSDVSLEDSNMTSLNVTTTNVTHTSSSMTSSTSTDWDQHHQQQQQQQQQPFVISTEGYAASHNNNNHSDIYQQHIPSISHYYDTSHSGSIPSQAGLAASYLTSGEHAQQQSHIPTSSLYNVLDLSNSSNSSFVYNVTLEGANDFNDSNGPLWVQPAIEVTTLEIVIAVVLSGFILSIIIGNMFVILSVALFRDMRTLTNGLIVSLASADLLVAIIVLPISLFHEIVGSWTLGPYVCDFWITSDVFCCTASILNIVVIAIDRYWLITKNVRYTHNHTFPRQRVVMIMCFVAWVLSGLISTSPLFGWQAGRDTMDPYMCIISQDLGYTIFSTFGAFWFPLTIILLVYMKIFKIARRRAKTRARAQAIHPSMNSTALSEPNGKAHAARRFSTRPSKSDSNSPQTSPKLHPSPPPHVHRRRVSQSHSKRNHRGRIRNSARTLGLIIGGFVFCWLPFFLLATILPFCAACQVPPYVMSIVLWLGYSNSLLNPAIYAIWDKNFRRSFKRLATCSVRWSHIL